MRLFPLFRQRASAPVARERLQILLSHERLATGRTDLVKLLRQDILAVVAKHIEVAPDKVRVTLSRNDNVCLLEIDVEVPAPKEESLAA